MKDYDGYWRNLGAHVCKDGSVVFRLLAPNADQVALTGDFDGWAEGRLMCRDEKGIYSITLPAGLMQEGDHYGFRIQHGRETHLKNDPVAFLSQPHSYGASRFYPFPRSYAWQDGGYLAARRIRFSHAREEGFPMPINIYELHLGSFRRDCPDYRTAARFLIPYLKRMSYTHVELLPLCEHPYGGSWGYQCLSYFAPTARFGLPEDLMAFVDAMHRAGIGVILDWVPAHFPKDEKGLYELDGTPLYEYSDPLRAEMPGWGTRCFDLGKEEVCDFLIASALFWLDQYHMDGLRVDAVSSMLYRNYGREEGHWRPGKNGSHISEDGVEFLRALNDAVFSRFPDVLMIAEESSAWEGVTRPTEDGGLGFSLKWNMGFANDTFAYLAIDPLFRRYHHEKLTFPLCYAFHERHLLPISHDEVVYGKRSLFSKMWGDRSLQAATFRAYYTLFLTYPGKKLLFMGTEFAQIQEWNWEGEVAFDLLHDPLHRALHQFVAEGNRFYCRSSPLWECDHTWEGFAWILPDEKDADLLAYYRQDRQGKRLLCVVCFAGDSESILALPISGSWYTVFTTWGKTGERIEPGMCLATPFGLIAQEETESQDNQK